MKTYLIGALAGVALALTGFFVVQHRSSLTAHAEITSRQGPEQIKERLDAAMTKTANDATALPELRADALAAKAKLDALFILDERLGSNETQVYIQQEGEHWTRVSDAARHPHPKPRITLSALAAMQAQIESAAGQLMPEQRADALATERKLEALTALDAFLGTSEEPIYLQQELDRQQRVLDVMQTNVR